MEKCYSESCSNRCTKRCKRCKSAFYYSKDCQKVHWSYHKENCDMLIHRCVICYKNGCSKRCRICESVFYCSESCQVTHLEQHKKSCLSLRAGKKLMYLYILCLLKVRDRRSPPDVFLRKGVLKIYSKFTGDHPCRRMI